MSIPEESARRNTTGDKVRASLTGAVIYAWSHVGYLLEIAGGKFAEHEGVNAWVAASAVGALATAETFGMSYLAEMGIGDFSAKKSSNRVVRRLQDSSKLSLGLSLWNGAPTGVALDKVYERPVSMRRRLAHSVPYGMAVDFWASPIKPAEWITGAIGHTLQFVEREAIHNPAVSTEIGALAVAAGGLYWATDRTRQKLTHLLHWEHEQSDSENPERL